jgi:hypothetical protein
MVPYRKTVVIVAARDAAGLPMAGQHFTDLLIAWARSIRGFFDAANGWPAAD